MDTPKPTENSFKSKLEKFMAKKLLPYEIDINASPEKVWHTMLDKETYEQWTAVFSAGSTYEGSWEEGAEIHFFDPDKSGMKAEIAENRLHEYISIKHLSMLQNGESVTGDEEWFPSYENYTFTKENDGTHLLVELEIPEEWAEMFDDMWPKGLQKVKELAES